MKAERAIPCVACGGTCHGPRFIPVERMLRYICSTCGYMTDRPMVSERRGVVTYAGFWPLMKRLGLR